MLVTSPRPLLLVSRWETRGLLTLRCFRFTRQVSKLAHRTPACFLPALFKAGRKQAFLSGWLGCGASFVCPIACPFLIAVAIAAVQRMTITGMDPLHSSGFCLNIKGPARSH